MITFHEKPNGVMSRAKTIFDVNGAIALGDEIHSMSKFALFDNLFFRSCEHDSKLGSYTVDEFN